MGDTSQGEPFLSGASEVAAEVAAWHRGAFPNARRGAVALKLVEEAVEAAVAAGASPMDVRRVADLALDRAVENPAAVEDELGDVFIVLAAIATRFVVRCPVAAASRKLDVLRARGPAEQARRDVARGITAVPEHERKVPRRDVPEHERVRKDRDVGHTTREYVNDMLTRGREVSRPVVVVRYRCDDCGGDVVALRPGGCGATLPAWPTAKSGVDVSHVCEGCGRPYWFDGVRYPYLAEQAEPGTGGEA